MPNKRVDIKTFGPKKRCQVVGLTKDLSHEREIRNETFPF